jgi:hypothetical protein
LTKNGVQYYAKGSQISKWLLRATLDKDITEARSIPESKRTDKQNYLAQHAIYFADNKGDFDKEQVYKYLQDVSKLLERDELLLLEGMRTAVIPDASAADSIYELPSLAMSTLKKSQDAIFGGDGSRLLLDRIDPIELDGLKSLAEMENKIKEVALEVKKEVLEGSGFDRNMTMAECREDKTMPKLVKELVGDGKDLSALKKHETTTARVAMKLVLIQVEMEALRGLISGRLRSHTRKNGRIAIWGKLPEGLWKFYCIGTVRKYNLSSRAAEFRITEGYTYIVSPNLFEMPLYGCEETDPCFVMSRFLTWSGGHCQRRCDPLQRQPCLWSRCATCAAEEI